MKIAVDSVIGAQQPPSIIRWLTPDRLSGSPGFLLFIIAALLISVTLLLYAQSLVAWMLQTYTGEKLLLEFRAALFRHVQRLSLSYHDTRGTTDSLYRIQYDTTSVQNITINTSLPLISSASTLIGMVAVTAAIDWQLALVALTVCPILYIFTRMFGSRLRHRWLEVKQYESSAMGVVEEALGALRVIKAFGTEQYEHERFMTRSREYLRGQIAVARLQGSFDLGIGVTIACGSAAALIIGVRHVTGGRITVGDLLLVTAYIAQIYTPLKTISKKIGDTAIRSPRWTRFCSARRRAGGERTPTLPPDCAGVRGGGVQKCVLWLPGWADGTSRCILLDHAWSARGDSRTNRGR